MERLMHCWMICDEVKKRYSTVVTEKTYETENAMWACIGAANAAAEIQFKIADLLMPHEPGSLSDKENDHD